MSAGFTLSGLVSGLDTASIIDGLMRIERIPLQSMRTRQQDSQERIDAFSRISTKLSGVREANDGLVELSAFKELSSATSSSEAVTAEVSGAPNAGTVSFTVDQLAGAHQASSTETYGSLNSTVGAGVVSLTIGGETTDITTTEGTSISDLASSINNLDLGVGASVLQLSDSSYKLVLTAEETGEDSVFTMSSTATGLTGLDTLQAGQDAVLTLGSGASALTIERSSNDIDDLIDGVDLTLTSTTTDPVTISTGRDVEKAAETITAYVDAVNAAINTAKTESLAAADEDARGTLAGDATVRRLIGDLQASLSAPVENLNGTYSFASSIGVEINSDGTFDVDADALKDALEEDFDAVANLFARGGTSDDSRVTYSRSTDDTVAGDYDVRVSQAAQVATVTGATYVMPPSDPEVFTITADDGTEVQVTVSVGDNAALAVSKINAALAAAEVTSIQASLSDATDEDTSPIVLAETRYGDHTFSVASDSGTQAAFGLTGTYTGQDVAGTIDGVAASGAGRELKSTDGDSDGLALFIAAAQSEVDAAGGDLDVGTFSYDLGISGAIASILDDFEGTDGLIAQATDNYQDRIDDIGDRITAFEQRMVLREEYLRRQFTAMEDAIARIQSQSSFMFAQLGQG